MTDLPDVACLIKVLDEDGKKVNNSIVWGTWAAVRYVVFNDSNVTAGPLTVVGVLEKDGVKIQPNVVPAQQITLQPGQIWTSTFIVNSLAPPHVFEARMLVDVGNWVDEEDEHNNKAKTQFAVAGGKP